MIADARKFKLVDHTGQPLESPKKRFSQQDFGTRRQTIEARYDAASQSDEFAAYWTNADALDADSAHSRVVRSRLVTRSRYEVANNGFADGMVQTHANYLCGLGPSLRMESNSPEFNRVVELSWYRWAKAVQLRRKLWCMAHAKVQDGEAFAIVRNNPRLRHPVGLDLALVETEQCQTPMLPYATPGYIDGIRFDEFGNAVYYDILPFHPGGQWTAYGQKPEQVPAKFVLHWFMLRRPAQHRGIPEFRSTLNTGASSRRWREATVAAAETAADIAFLLETELTGDDGPDLAAPYSTSQLKKRTIVAAPAGYSGKQVKAEHPNATYEAFHKAQINEQARPKSMPYNLAACDSSSYNYASGRLDHQTYFSTLDVERADGDDLVLDPLFRLWFERAVYTYGWATDADNPPDHSWDWPKHPVADIESEANARNTNLRNGSLTLTRLYADNGEDFDDEIETIASDYGVTTDEARKILRVAMFNASNQQAGYMLAENQAKNTQQSTGGPKE
jgi:capsid protein